MGGRAKSSECHQDGLSTVRCLAGQNVMTGRVARTNYFPLHCHSIGVETGRRIRRPAPLQRPARSTCVKSNFGPPTIIGDGAASVSLFDDAINEMSSRRRLHWPLNS